MEIRLPIAAAQRPMPRGSDRRFVRPVVRALPSPTAHPSSEAWPAGHAGVRGRVTRN